MAIKKISANLAYAQFTKLYPLAYTVADKFKTDHTLAAPNLSKKTSIEAAVARYKKNTKITTSSWMLLDASTLVNKAAGAPKRATVYNGAQQMTLQLTVKRRTVRIEKLEPKELQRYEHTDVKVGTETHHLNCSSDEKDVKINVVGGWSPLAGDVEMYHYEEAALPGAHVLLDKYLEWNVDDATEAPVSPTAKT
jgi:hypothetical protein